MMKEPRTSEKWAFVYKSARHHIQTIRSAQLYKGPV